MSTAWMVRPKPLTITRPPIKCPAYLRFIRTLPCCACGSTLRIEAAHIGPRGLGQKVDDKNALPLCFWCHRELHEVGPVEFATKYGVDFPALIAKWNHFYESNLRGTW